MNKPSLRCRCGGMYIRSLSNFFWDYDYIMFKCEKCGRVVASPCELEQDLRFELQQMNLRLPDGFVDTDGDVRFVASLGEEYFQTVGTVQNKNCMLVFAQLFDSIYQALKNYSVFSSPINRRQAKEENSDVGFFDQPLTADEVESLYNGGTGRAYPIEQTFFADEARGW